MSWLDEISNFLEYYSGVHPDNPNIDIWGDMGVVGDDFHEMMENYSKQYDVDLSGYLWYFHTDEEGTNIGGLFFKPPYQRVKRIAVTPKMLADFIQTKKWLVNYPPHEIPKKRIDLTINLLVLVVTLAGVIIWILNKYVF
jgi:hypothetical protein